MAHYKQPAMIGVGGVGGVVCELSAYEDRHALLLVIFFLVVARLATISALGGVVLSARFGMTAPPST